MFPKSYTEKASHPRCFFHAPTTGINWRRAENKNNSASGYGVLLSKNQHLSDQVLFLYPNHERTDSNGRRNRQPEHAEGGTQPPAIDYGKIEDMIHKGTQQRESAILEGYFKQLGMSGEELQTAVQDFKTKRATQAKEKETSYQNAQQEIVRLKAQVLENDIRSKASDIAADLGVDRKSLPYLLRMADMTSAADNKGVISEENIKKALEKVLTDVPALKGST